MWAIFIHDDQPIAHKVESSLLLKELGGGERCCLPESHPGWIKKGNVFSPSPVGTGSKLLEVDLVKKKKQKHGIPTPRNKE